MERKNFEYMLYMGKSVLNNTCIHIQKLFFGKEMCLYEYSYADHITKGLEVILDDDIVLVCVFEFHK